MFYVEIKRIFNMKAIFSFFLLIAFQLLGCEKSRLDQQVRVMCEKDGGLKVYEAIRLPSEKFNQWGQPNFFKPTQGEDALGAEYIFQREIHFYQKGNPSMSRESFKVIRKSDGKLLGESVIYGRGGGDIPGPWHGSSFTCPPEREAGVTTLLSRIFVKEKGE